MTVSHAARAVVLTAVRTGYVAFINTTRPAVSMTEMVADHVIEALLGVGWTPPDDE